MVNHEIFNKSFSEIFHKIFRLEKFYEILHHYPRGTKTPTLTVFATSTFCVGATWQLRDKFERVSKSLPYFNSLTAKLFARCRPMPFQAFYIKNKQTLNFSVPREGGRKLLGHVACDVA